MPPSPNGRVAARRSRLPAWRRHRGGTMPDTGNQHGDAPEPTASDDAGLAGPSADAPSADAPTAVDENYVAPNEYTPVAPYVASDPSDRTSVVEGQSG